MIKNLFTKLYESAVVWLKNKDKIFYDFICVTFHSIKRPSFKLFEKFHLTNLLRMIITMFIGCLKGLAFSFFIQIYSNS